MSDSDRLADVSAALVAATGPDVAIALWGIDVSDTVHDPIEEGFIARAVEKRRVEFRRGRACARAALASLGAPPGPIAVGENREPVWPDGFVGSITHCDDVIAAAVAPRTATAGLGVDIERAAPLDDGARALALTRPEIERLGAPWEAALVFSAKESVFKTVFPISRRWIGFEEVEIEVHHTGPRGGSTGAGTWAATLLRVNDDHQASVAALVGSVLGRWRRTPDHVITAGRLPVAGNADAA